MKLLSTCALTSSFAIARALIGEIDSDGYCQCPGRHLHTKETRHRDCRLWLDGAPTIFCLHSSCADVVATANMQLRSAIGKGQTVTHFKLSPLDRAAKFAKQLAIETAEDLKRRAGRYLPNLLQKFSLDLPDLWELSPIRLESDPANDWRLLLRLFQPDDVVWIGDVHDSGPGKGRHFQTVEKWLAYPMAPGNFTCPAIFKNNVESRSSLNVIARPFLVVESDTLTKPEMCAVFNWLRPIMRLRAVVDTAGKSLHAWFDFPPKEALVELENVLPAMGCDKALFKPSQPCRLPGAARADKGGKIQSPCFLDLQK